MFAFFIRAAVWPFFSVLSTRRCFIRLASLALVGLLLACANGSTEAKAATLSTACQAVNSDYGSKTFSGGQQSVKTGYGYDSSFTDGEVISWSYAITGTGGYVYFNDAGANGLEVNATSGSASGTHYVKP